MMAMLKIGFGTGFTAGFAAGASMGSAASTGMDAGGVGVGAGVWFGSTPGGVGMVWALVWVLLKAMGCPVSLLGMDGNVREAQMCATFSVPHPRAPQAGGNTNRSSLRPGVPGSTKTRRRLAAAEDRRADKSVSADGRVVGWVGGRVVGRGNDDGRQRNHLPLAECENAEHDQAAHAGDQQQERHRTGHAGLGKDAPEQEDDEGQKDEDDDQEDAAHAGHKGAIVLCLVGVHVASRSCKPL